MATTLTSKGQVTVPKKIRDYLGLRPGAAVDFGFGPNGEVVVSAAEDCASVRRKGRFNTLLGTLETGKSTDTLMRLLRDYDADASDPGLQ